MVSYNDLSDLGLPYCDVLLTDLTIKPGLLTPPFDPYRDTYIASTTVSLITLMPRSDHIATLQFLGENRSHIADADVNLSGHQVRLVTDDITVVKVWITSQDSEASHTYTINIAVVNASGVRLSISGKPKVRLRTPISVTAKFSGPVSGFDVDNVIVANGFADNFAGTDGDSVYTFDVTTNAIGVVTVDIPAGVAGDSVGYGNTAAEQLTLGIPYDDDHDGAISGLEVLAAVADYFRDSLSAGHVLQVVALYFASSN